MFGLLLPPLINLLNGLLFIWCWLLWVAPGHIHLFFSCNSFLFFQFIKYFFLPFRHLLSLLLISLLLLLLNFRKLFLIMFIIGSPQHKEYYKSYHTDQDISLESFKHFPEIGPFIYFYILGRWWRGRRIHEIVVDVLGDKICSQYGEYDDFGGADVDSWFFFLFG